MRKRNLILGLIVLIISSACFARGNDGTIPLKRRPGDGTIPLRFMGSALNSAGSASVQTRLEINSITYKGTTDQRTITRSCRSKGADVSLHRAKGTIFVGRHKFMISGVCYNGATYKFEFLGQSIEGEKVYFVAAMKKHQNIKKFVGRLIVEDRRSTTRYTCSLNAD